MLLPMNAVNFLDNFSADRNISVIKTKDRRRSHISYPKGFNSRLPTFDSGNFAL
jgi:hypothetical protein